MPLKDTEQCTHIFVISIFISFLSEEKKPVEEIVPKMVAQTTEEKPQNSKKMSLSSLCPIITDVFLIFI